MNKKRTLWAVRIILIALIVCWMMTIFDFSAANGQQSQSYSDGITIKIIRLIKKDCNMLSKDRQQEYFNQVSFFVRKTGHFGEYGILSLLWSGFLLTFKSIRKIKNIYINTNSNFIGICGYWWVSSGICWWKKSWSKGCIYWHFRRIYSCSFYNGNCMAGI